MQLLLDVKDERAPFVLEVLKNLKFINAKEISPYEAEVLSDIKDGIEELKLVFAGKLRARPVEEIISELQDQDHPLL